MNRRRVLINTGLGALALGLVVAGVVALAAPREDPNASLPTALVVRGPLQATVTATGNTVSGRTASLQFAGTGGTITKVYVRPGVRVSEGDRLARIDATSARQQLASAKASLRTAQAALTTTTAGRTSAERAADSAQVASAEQAVRNAERALAGARKTLDLVRGQQAQIVADAEQAVGAAQQAAAATEDALADLNRQLAATDPADTAAIADLNARIAAAQSTLASQRAAQSNAEAALTQARRARDSAVLQAQQAVTAQTGARDTARKALAQQKAAVAVARQGPRAGAVQSAQAQVDAAQVAVDQARQAVRNTVLRAPFAGTVSTVNAVVGQTTSLSGATGEPGLVVVVDPRGLSVTASIAEADATSVQRGQSATVTLPASGTTMTGTVISVDVASTVSNNVVQYSTSVSLDAPPATVRVGQTASLSIVTGSAESTLYVPTSAIQADGAARYVTRVTTSGQQRVEVTTGMVGTTGTEILSGLSKGDRVLLPEGDTSTGLPFGNAGTGR